MIFLHSFDKDKSIIANLNSIINLKWHYFESCDDILNESKSEWQWYSLYIYTDSKMMYNCKQVVNNTHHYIYSDLNTMHNCEKSKSEISLSF